MKSVFPEAIYDIWASETSRPENSYSTPRGKDPKPVEFDLKRHMRTHLSREADFPCPHTNCRRKMEPFKRRDHLIQHLRKVHLEELERTKRTRRRKQTENFSAVPSSSPSNSTVPWTDLADAPAADNSVTHSLNGLPKDTQIETYCCEQVIECFAICRCVFKVHPVKLCQFRINESKAHVIQRREVLVGSMCSHHSSLKDRFDQQSF